VGDGGSEARWRWMMVAAGVRLVAGDDAMATEFGFAMCSKSSLYAFNQRSVKPEWHAVCVVLNINHSRLDKVCDKRLRHVDVGTVVMKTSSYVGYSHGEEWHLRIGLTLVQT
jgi:hypothetical protein